MNKIKKLNFIVPTIVIILTIASFLGYKASKKMDTMIPYKTFISEVQNGNVSDVYLSDSQRIKVILKNKTEMFTENPRTLNFKEYLLLKGIKVHEGGAVSPYEAVPTAILLTIIVATLIYFISRKTSSNSGAFKLSTMDISPEKDWEINFDSIAGNLEAKESVRELVDFIKNPEKFTKYNARMPRGVILYGPPGTGKTLMAKALAGEANVPFYAVNGSDFVQIYVGVGAGRIRDLFKKAREKGKAVIFIDEIDAIGKKRDGRADGGSDERDQTLNALLAEMSGFKESQGIIVIAATNRLDVLDEALLRPGRFDRHIEVGLPDVNARHEILKLHCKDKPISEDVNLYKIAQMTVYFSGAKLENLVNEAAILAARENSQFINMNHFDLSYGIVLAGAEKKDRSFIKENDKKITAYHEAGHALISKLISPENHVRKVTIIPSTKGAGGYTLNIPPDRIYHTKTQLLNNIKVALGGRAAEELIFGKDNITTGASGDIENATNTLLAMIKYYGMFESTGLLNYNILDKEGISNNAAIVEVCNKTITELYNEVSNILKENKSKLDALANMLLEEETIYDEQIEKIIA